jgi:hypothetical protein
VLIDVGNVLSGAGSDADFDPIFDHIRGRLDGRPLDLYVMSHEHLDHVRGLAQAAAHGVRLPIDFAWLTASAEDGYYQRFPEARRRLALANARYEAIRLAAASGPLGATVQAFLANNDPKTTGESVAFLRTAANTTRYVHRGFRPARGRDHPFTEARLSVWAPELDTSDYFGRPKPFVPPRAGADVPKPPDGVDRAAFRDLMAFLEAGLGDSMLAIDRAANDTSVVLALEWRGWRLLFPGDAEIRSWETMSAHGQLRPVHLLKVSHHASRNGTPSEAILDEILPDERPDDRPRRALVSTWPEVYSGVPDGLTIARLGRRVDDVIWTRSAPSGTPVVLEFEDR